MKATRRVVVAAAVWSLVSMAIDHWRGLYEPSETTGHGAGAGALAGLVAGSAVLAWINGREPRLRSWRRLMGLVLAVALAVTLGQAIYFGVFRPGFSGQMMAFTTRVLGARHEDPARVREFAQQVGQSWTTGRVVGNVALRFLVWGSVFGTMVWWPVTAFRRYRAGEAEANSGPGRGG